jgi:hypothetical protein
MITNTPWQARKIAAMMAGRRLTLRNPGPRIFPKYTGQSTREYVREYEYANRDTCYAFKLTDLLPPVGTTPTRRNEHAPQV